MIVTPRPLTRDAFRAFGDVLEIEGSEPRRINRGLTLKFERLSRLEVAAGDRMQICLYRSEPVELPFRIEELERHPLGSQAFVPLHPRPFPVVVAAGDATPGIADLRVFLTNGRQGVCISPGVWHHHQLTLDRVSDYLVLERDGEDGNLEQCRLRGTAILHV